MRRLLTALAGTALMASRHRRWALRLQARGGLAYLSPRQRRGREPIGSASWPFSACSPSYTSYDWSDSAHHETGERR